MWARSSGIDQTMKASPGKSLPPPSSLLEKACWENGARQEQAKPYYSAFGAKEMEGYDSQKDVNGSILIEQDRNWSNQNSSSQEYAWNAQTTLPWG